MAAKPIATYSAPGDSIDYLCITEKKDDPTTAVITARTQGFGQPLEMSIQSLFLFASQINGYLAEYLYGLNRPTDEECQAQADKAHQEFLDSQRDDRTP